MNTVLQVAALIYLISVTYNSVFVTTSISLRGRLKRRQAALA